MKVFQIKRIVPNLIDRIFAKLFFANFEFQDEDGAFSDYHSVDATSDSGDIKFKAEESINTPQRFFQDVDFFEPSIALFDIHGKLPVDTDLPNHFLIGLPQEYSDLLSIVSARSDRKRCRAHDESRMGEYLVFMLFAPNIVLTE